MSKVFVDTWAWYEKLLTDGYTFVTTNFVLDEAVTLILYKLNHAAAVRFRHTLQQLTDAGLVELVRIDEAHETAAWEIFERYADQRFSYTDCTSFAVMHTLGLTHAFTADHHFAVMEFSLVP